MYRTSMSDIGQRVKMLRAARKERLSEHANAYANACEDSMRTHSEGNAPNTNTNKNTPLPPEAGGGGGKPLGIFFALDVKDA